MKMTVHPQAVTFYDISHEIDFVRSINLTEQIKITVWIIFCAYFCMGLRGWDRSVAFRILK